ncbi:MAG: response regulator [Planctomycetota bacterium]|jgi:DNA-binding response OmpR family regulator
MARILITDDDAHVVRIMSMWLARQGHEVLEARSGQAALDLLDQHEVDFIISDVNMPGMNGIEFLRATREQKNVGVPFLLISSRCDQRELREIVKPLGARLYPKPFVPSKLVADIEEMLSSVGM